MKPRTIIISCSAFLMLWILWMLKPATPNPAYMQPDEVTHWNKWATNNLYAKTNKWKRVSEKDPTPIFRAFNRMNSASNNPTPADVVIRYDLRGTNEISMIEKMTAALATLGIVKDERTVQRLVAARVVADWSKTPDSFRSAPDWAALQAHTLKGKIARLLGTNDTLSIQRILEADIGPTVPPMGDFEVREGPDAVWREAEAMK